VEFAAELSVGVMKEESGEVGLNGIVVVAVVFLGATKNEKKMCAFFAKVVFGGGKFYEGKVFRV